MEGVGEYEASPASFCLRLKMLVWKEKTKSTKLALPRTGHAMKQYAYNSKPDTTTADKRHPVHSALKQTSVSLNRLRGLLRPDAMP